MTRQSRQAGWLACLLLLCVIAPASPQNASAQKQTITIGYVEIDGDPRYEPIKAYERLILKVRGHPFAGAQVGIDDAKVLNRVMNTDFALERITVKSADQITPAVQQAMDSRGIHFFIVDAPAAAFVPLAQAVRGRDVLLFNATAPEDALRRDVCASEIVHTFPSLAMSMDGLMQYLISRKWRDALVLQGPQPADATAAAAFEASAKKFGARVVANKQFKLGTNPREREQNNPELLSAIGRDYDVVFVADEAFDFARQVPYHLIRPRPVVGGIDLEPAAWHWTWEHNGAPQVNARFQKMAGRRMEAADWAAWMSVKMVVQAALRTRSTDFETLRTFIFGSTDFDGDKGLPMSIRPWDHQLRQAILLATPYYVVASAPIDGFLHRTNVLDTLGDDETESACRLKR